MVEDDHLTIGDLVHVQTHARHPAIVLVQEGVIAVGPSPPLLKDVMTTLLHPVGGLLIALLHPGILYVVEMVVDHILQIMTEMKLQMENPSMKWRMHGVAEIRQGDCQDHRLALDLDLLTCRQHEVDEHWRDVFIFAQLNWACLRSAEQFMLVCSFSFI